MALLRTPELRTPDCLVSMRSASSRLTTPCRQRQSGSLNISGPTSLHKERRIPLTCALGGQLTRIPSNLLNLLGHSMGLNILCWPGIHPLEGMSSTCTSLTPITVGTRQQLKGTPFASDTGFESLRHLLVEAVDTFNLFLSVQHILH